MTMIVGLSLFFFVSTLLTYGVACSVFLKRMRQLDIIFVKHKFSLCLVAWSLSPFQFCVSLIYISGMQ